MRTFFLVLVFFAPFVLSAQSGTCSFRLPAAAQTIHLAIDSVLHFEQLVTTAVVAEAALRVSKGTLTGHVVALNEPDAKGRRILWFVLDQPAGNLRVDDLPRPLQLDAHGCATAPGKTWTAQIWVEGEGTCAVEGAR